MNETETRQAAFVCQMLELGKPPSWIVDALVQGEYLDRPAATLLVSRVARGLETRQRSRRRRGRIGLVLLAASIIPWFLGLPGRPGRTPLWPGLFSPGSNLPSYLLVPAFIGAFLFFSSLAGRRPRWPRESPQRLPPGQIPPGWPGPGAPELPPQPLPPGQVPPGWRRGQVRDSDPS